MGCSDSKEAQTKDQNKPADKPAAAKKEDKPVEKKDDQKEEAPKGGEEKQDDCPWKTKSEAVAYLVKELGIKQENAEKIVDTISDDEGDKLDAEQGKKMKELIEKAKNELKPLYDSADTNGTGEVNSLEAAKAFGPLFPLMKETGMRKMIRSFEDGEKYVQFGEFCIFYIFIENARRVLRPVFDSCDANGTGTVTLTEAAAKLCEKYPNMDERAVKKMLYRCGDGDGIVTYEEFIVFYANLKRAKKTVLKKFESLEKDSDGMVQESEVVKLLMEETGMDEDDCKALVNSSDESNDARCSAEEFINMWSKMTAK